MADLVMIQEDVPAGQIQMTAQGAQLLHRPGVLIMGRLTSVNAGAGQGSLGVQPRAKPPNLKSAENALLVLRENR